MEAYKATVSSSRQVGSFRGSTTRPNPGEDCDCDVSDQDCGCLLGLIALHRASRNQSRVEMFGYLVRGRERGGMARIELLGIETGQDRAVMRKLCRGPE